MEEKKLSRDSKERRLLSHIFLCLPETGMCNMLVWDVKGEHVLQYHTYVIPDGCNWKESVTILHDCTPGQWER